MQADSTERIDIALPFASAITGRVVDEFGEPVERASVSAMKVGVEAHADVGFMLGGPRPVPAELSPRDDSSRRTSG